jgi:hypothetical protein
LNLCRGFARFLGVFDGFDRAFAAFLDVINDSLSFFLDGLSTFLHISGQFFRACAGSLGKLLCTCTGISSQLLCTGKRFFGGL